MKVGVFKFSSCDGCQLAFFDLSEEILRLSEKLEILYFLEASSKNVYDSFDISFVEGSISTQEEIERIKSIRERSKVLVAIGACAVSGGIQSARNFENYEEVFKEVYKDLEMENVLRNAYPISRYVKVDFSLFGCPINSDALKEFLISTLLGKSPMEISYPVCLECKRKGNPCVVVLKNALCLGPITRAGCGALCPSFRRGCYGCYGPIDKPNIDGFEEKFGKIDEAIKVSFNAFNPTYRGVFYED